jgi:bacillithiol synthase
MPTLRHVPIRSMGSSLTQTRYLEEDPDLEQFLGRRPRNVEDLLRRAPINARRLLSPESIATALEAYAVRHGAPEESIAAARSLAGGDVHFIVTGQQPGLFGGPLYTVHKAATTVRLAREINALQKGPRVVPLFWNHTDDHDLDEVNRAFFVNSSLEIQRIRLDLARGGEAIRDIGIGRDLDHALAAVSDLLPHSEFREWALDLFRPRQPDEHFGDALARALFGMFGKHGMLVIEPRDLPAQAFDVLPRWWEQCNEIQTSIGSTIEVLSEIGLDISMDPSATLMFQNTGGRRSAMAEGDAVNHVTDLSPGALLRPLWQDACLPTLGSVVGPGELSYLSVAGPLYRQLGVPAPVFVPRASLTLVEPSLAKLLVRFNWDIPDLEAGAEQLAQSAIQDDADDDESGLEALIEHVTGQMTELAQSMRTTDAQMVRGVERTRGKVRDELTKLLNKLRNSRQNREGTGVRQIRRVVNSLRPRGRPQERVLTVLPFLASHGEVLADQLVDAADPFTSGHGVLEL